MNKKPGIRAFASDAAILLYIALAVAVAHLLVADRYGYFIDELYTMACSRHLSLAFVDIPPVAPSLLALNTAVFGDSLFALHILPSLFSGAIVIIVGLIAREMGGGRLAVALAGLCAAFMPVWMTLGTLFTYDFLDQFMLVSLLYALVRLIKRENPKTWLAIGAIAGVGMMTKPSEVFYIAGIAIALFATKHRKQYLTRWPWLGAAIALAIVSPALVWQALHGFPIASYWVSYSAFQAVHVNPLEFMLMQVVAANVALLPVWVAGLGWLLFGKEGKRFRLLGVLCCVLFAVFLLTGAKVYMPTPLYAVMVAGGAVALERFVAARRWRKALAGAYACVAVFASLLQAPVFMPVLPVDTLVKYYDAVGGAFGMKSVKLGNYEENDVLPQFIYDRFDWDTLASDIAEVYMRLPEGERESATILTPNYGIAGAVDLFGEKYGLPKAACPSLNYAYFSAGNVKAGTYIVTDVPVKYLEQWFADVKEAKISVSAYRQPHKKSIYLCRGPQFSMDEMQKLFREGVNALPSRQAHSSRPAIPGS